MRIGLGKKGLGWLLTLLLFLLWRRMVTLLLGGGIHCRSPALTLFLTALGEPLLMRAAIEPYWHPASL